MKPHGGYNCWAIHLVRVHCNTRSDGFLRLQVMLMNEGTFVVWMHGINDLQCVKTTSFDSNGQLPVSIEMQTRFDELWTEHTYHHTIKSSLYWLIKLRKPTEQTLEMSFTKLKWLVVHGRQIFGQTVKKTRDIARSSIFNNTNFVLRFRYQIDI